MASARDMRCFLMDALAATTTLAGGLAHMLERPERAIAEQVAPKLEESRFWVVGRRHGQANHAVIAWSPVRQIAKALARLAVAFGLHDVSLVDCETDDEERVNAA